MLLGSFFVSYVNLQGATLKLEQLGLKWAPTCKVSGNSRGLIHWALVVPPTKFDLLENICNQEKKATTKVFGFVFCSHRTCLMLNVWSFTFTQHVCNFQETTAVFQL